MKHVVFLCAVGFTLTFTAQIKINVNGSNVTLKGKGSNTNKSNGSNDGTTNGTANSSNDSYNFERNPDAPATVNNNIAAGAFCVVIDSRGYLSRKRVYQVVDGGYAIIDANATDWDLKNNANAIRYFAANSVYPDVDFTKFRNECRPYEEYVRHYLNCYASNHLPSLSVLTNWNERWPAYYLGSVREAKEHQRKLKSLDSLFKLRYSSLPNFYCKYEDNPFIWGQIAMKRDSLISCLLSSSGDGEFGVQITNMVTGITDEIKDAVSFNNGGDWFVNDDLVGQAVSPKARQERFTNLEGFFNDYAELAKLTGRNPSMPKDTLTLLLDNLKSTLKTALPKHKPTDNMFKFRDAGLESKMKAYLKNAAALTVYKIGLTHDVWQIKKNDVGIPEYKYKYGAMYVKNPSWDHGYCKVLFFTLKQDYAGGGTYGETHVGWYSEEYYGCP
jgi:hypothetical protein